MSTVHGGNEGTCWNDDCPRCRSTPEQTRERALAEHKRRLKTDEWVDTNSYTPEEQLTNLRVAGARRQGMAR